jgi:hypothetical protein
MRSWLATMAMPERPAPGEVVDEDAADHGADDAGDGEGDPLVAEPAPELAGGHQVGDHGHRHRADATAAHALQEPGQQQLVHRLGQAARQRAEEEHDDGRQQDALAPVEVADLAPQRHRRDLGQQVGGDHPRHPGEPADVVGDRGQGGRHDRAVHGAQHHHQLQADERDHGLTGDLPLALPPNRHRRST